MSGEYICWGIMHHNKSDMLYRIVGTFKGAAEAWLVQCYEIIISKCV